MKVLFVIAIILALIAAVGVVCLIWAMAWLAFEESKFADAIYWRIKYGRSKDKWVSPSTSPDR